MPATPMATSVRPSRQGRPKVSVMMTGMERCRVFFSCAVNSCGGTVGIFRKQERVTASVDVGDINRAVGADQAVVGFRDQHAALAADDAAALGDGQFDDTRIEIVATRPAPGS